MGAASVKSPGSSQPSRLQQAATKVAAVRALSSPRGPRPDREDIYQFVQAQKTAQEEAWRKHREEASTAEKPQERSPEDAVYDVNIQTREQLVHNFCLLCGQPTRLAVDGHPCRVCGQTQHNGCVLGDQTLSETEKKLYKERAASSVGWSCQFCDNICNLLTESEIEKLAEEFEQLDVNNDAAISVEEYLTFRRRQWERLGMQPEPEQETERVVFRLMDTDRSGHVSYWEFIKHGAATLLARRTPHELVSLLTDLEKQAARLAYNMLDTDGDGKISEEEAQSAYRSWYQHMDRISGKARRLTGDGQESASLPVWFLSEQAATRLMEADENSDREISWPEFLRSQALRILSSRPNAACVD